MPDTHLHTVMLSAETQGSLDYLHEQTGMDVAGIISNALQLYEAIVSLSINDVKFYKQQGNRAIEPFAIFSPGDPDAEP